MDINKQLKEAKENKAVVEITLMSGDHHVGEVRSCFGGQFKLTDSKNKEHCFWVSSVTNCKVLDQKF